MGYDRGSVLILADGSTGNSSTCLEPRLHIMNHTSYPTRAIPNFCPLIVTKISTRGKCLLPFIYTAYAKELDWVSDGGVNYTNNREECRGSRLVSKNSKRQGGQFSGRWDLDTRGIFTERYGDIAHLITIRVDEQLIQAMVRFWDPAYQCFTFNQEDMTPTIEEYAALLRINNVQFGKIYVKKPKPMTFKKKLVRLTDMTDAWAKKQIKKKNETICIPWSSLRDLVLNHPDMLKRVNLFALAIYGLVIFSKVLEHLEVAVVDFFERLKQGINPVPTILAETFRSLNSCRKIGKGHFIGYAQLLNVWILSHFWKVERTPFHMFSKTFAPPEAYLKKEWPKEVTEQHWVSVFQNLRAEDIMWRAPWIRPSVLLYRVGDQDWIPLLELWGGVGYDPLLVQRQFSSRQFIPATGGLAQSEFAFTGEGYMKRVRDTAKSWKKVHSIELALYADTLTQDYDLWRKQRVNSQQISSTNYTVQNPFSEEMPSELEMARQEFEREKAKMSRDLSALQEENYQLKIDVQIERFRTEKVQKEAEVVRNDLRDLHLENKKLRGTIKNSGLSKSTAEWKEEISNIKGGMEFWKGKAKKEEEKAARAAIELRRKNVEYEMVTAEFANSQSEHQELKKKARDLENMLQSRQQQLDNLLKALEEKNDQYDRDIHAYEGTLQEKEMQLDFLINEIRKAAMQVVQLSDEAEVLSCQFPPSQRSSISEFLEQVKKQGNVARKFV
ncbi:hypothetical protein CXB51_021022 [Gossypium anomalum]|uniref:DUF7745 domain-containing protein n=1 Tax=Gossypium anomalum TaxID=47600 RepID=A0A8J5YMZ6_9ROSI|nr:hypothetical protein CXB51_021022 [Gossypium anomalum]